MSDVTTILVAKNGAKYIEAAIRSALNQSLKPAELLCIVGPSNDGTWELVGQFDDVKRLIQHSDGLAEARNQAISAASHELIAFLDCDDRWHPNKLAMQVGALKQLDWPGYSITMFRRFDDSASSGARSTFTAAQLGVTPSALVAHREVFNQIGGFDRDLPVGCDSDWFVRAQDAGIPCCVIDEVLVDKRIHDNNLGADWRLNRSEIFKILAKRRRARVR